MIRYSVKVANLVLNEDQNIFQVIWECVT